MLEAFYILSIFAPARHDAQGTGAIAAGARWIVALEDPVAAAAEPEAI